MNNPQFILLPVNNNRTAWRPFGLPVVLIVPHVRDQLGFPIPNSQIENVEVFIEDVPSEARVTGHQNIGIRLPDKELYKETLTPLDLRDKSIDLRSFQITRAGQPVSFQQARNGDTVLYTSADGTQGELPFVQGAEYFDLSEVKLDLEILTPDNYNLVYATTFFKRKISRDGLDQFICIDINTKQLQIFKFPIQHPGQVMQTMYNLTPVPYLSNDRKSLDSTVAFYRPFSDILQDIHDEQDLLESINWVFDTPPEFIPYLSSLLGWDLPYYPTSLDKLRRAVLRRTVEFQNLKGSKRGVVELFRLFGFEILISNLYWSEDGTRLIRPRVTGSEVLLDLQLQVEQVLYDRQLANNFEHIQAPLLYRPKVRGLNGIIGFRDSGPVTLYAWAVSPDSDADLILRDLEPDQLQYFEGQGGLQVQPQLLEIQQLPGVIGFSNIFIDATEQILVDSSGQPPFVLSGCNLDYVENKISLIPNGSFPTGTRLYCWAVYSRQRVDVPKELEDLRSNRFDLQILSIPGLESPDPTILDFVVSFLFKIKAFHSLLNVIISQINLTENYEVTDLCVGGGFLQRFDTQFGQLQVPPAIVPNIPAEDVECAATDPESLGYKPADLQLRAIKIESLQIEHAAWRDLNEVSAQNFLSARIAANQPEDGDCRYTKYGQAKVIGDREEVREFSTQTNTNKSAQASGSNTRTTPVTSVEAGQDIGPTSSRNDSSSYGSFVVEKTGPRNIICDDNNGLDYCFKGRVDDELLHRSSLAIRDYWRYKACNLGMGTGTYWTFPSVSRVFIHGASNRAAGSRSIKPILTANSEQQKTSDYLLVSGDLSQPYSAPLRPDSFLGRLYRNYDRPAEQTIHFDNDIGISRNVTQLQQLAIQRPSIEIDKPTLHLPGCRFPTMNRLEFDYIAPYEHKPYDFDICDSRLGAFTLDVDTSGDECLQFDLGDFTVLGNGLPADIESLADQTGTLVDLDYVIHSIYSKDINANPAIIFDQLCDFTGEFVETQDPLFESACSQTDGYFDFADGYACSRGPLPFEPGFITRNADFDEVMIGLGLMFESDFLTGVDPIDYPSQFLFTLGSGILLEKGFRLDCDVKAGSCVPTEIELLEFDELAVQTNVVLDESQGIQEIYLDGTIPSMLEVL